VAEIHADAPPFVEMSIEQEILETGLKVVDLLAPYAKGGKIGNLYFLLYRPGYQYTRVWLNGHLRVNLGQLSCKG